MESTEDGRGTSDGKIHIYPSVFTRVIMKYWVKTNEGVLVARSLNWTNRSRNSILYNNERKKYEAKEKVLEMEGKKKEPKNKFYY